MPRFTLDPGDVEAAELRALEARNAQGPPRPPEPGEAHTKPRASDGEGGDLVGPITKLPAHRVRVMESQG